MGAQRQDRNPANRRPRTGVARARKLFLAGIGLAALFFALGLAAARWIPAGAPVDTALQPPSARPAKTADIPEPQVVIDPATIQLLPDASLRLDLPPSFDAGEDP